MHVCMCELCVRCSCCSDLVFFMCERHQSQQIQALLTSSVPLATRWLLNPRLHPQVRVLVVTPKPHPQARVQLQFLSRLDRLVFFLAHLAVILLALLVVTMGRGVGHQVKNKCHRHCCNCKRKNSTRRSASANGTKTTSPAWNKVCRGLPGARCLFIGTGGSQ